MQPSAFTGKQTSSQYDEEETPASSHAAGNHQFNTQRAAAKSSLQMLNIILNGLIDFFQLTEEEQKDAGIYYGNRRFED